MLLCDLQFQKMGHALPSRRQLWCGCTPSVKKFFRRQRGWTGAKCVLQMANAILTCGLEVKFSRISHQCDQATNPLYLFASFYNFLEVVVSMDALYSGQSLATIPLLYSYMNEVASSTAAVIVNSGKRIWNFKRLDFWTSCLVPEYTAIPENREFQNPYFRVMPEYTFFLFSVTWKWAWWISSITEESSKPLLRSRSAKLSNPNEPPFSLNLSSLTWNLSKIKILVLIGFLMFHTQNEGIWCCLFKWAGAPQTTNEMGCFFAFLLRCLWPWDIQFFCFAAFDHETFSFNPPPPNHQQLRPKSTPSGGARS